MGCEWAEPYHRPVPQQETGARVARRPPAAAGLTSTAPRPLVRAEDAGPWGLRAPKRPPQTDLRCRLPRVPSKEVRCAFWGPSLTEAAFHERTAATVE